MNEIKDVKVWKAPKFAKPETRIYVHTTDNREGCRYLTGNPWHTAKSVDGNLTAEEWKQAREIAYYDESWHTIYQNDNPRPTRCPDCGRYDCGSNCNANAPLPPARGDGREHATWETEEALAGLGL